MAAAYVFLSYNWILVCEIYFGLVGTTSVLAKDFDLCSIYCSNLTGRSLQNFEFSQ